MGPNDCPSPRGQLINKLEQKNIHSLQCYALMRAVRMRLKFMPL